MMKRVVICITCMAYLALGAYLYDRFEQTDRIGHSIFECAQGSNDYYCAEGDLLGKIDDIKRSRLWDGMIFITIILAPLFLLVVFPLWQRIQNRQPKNNQPAPIKSAVDRIVMGLTE